MSKLFQTGNSEVTEVINVGLELANNVWLKAAFLQALSLMCNPDNWETQGTATVEFAADKSNEMYVSVIFDMIIPFLPIGTVMMWMTNSIPDKWLELGGQALSKTIYPELFEIFGYTHGGGSDTFVLPSYRGYSPYGAGADIDVQNKGGAATRNININNLPAHNHSVIDPGHNHQASNAGSFLVNGGTGTKNHQPFAGSTGRAEADTSTKTTGITIGNTGSGDAINILHPVFAARYIIYAGV